MKKMGIDWSEFQPELLEIIANKLTIYIDYVRFRAVCVKWRSSVSPNPHHLPTKLPWLLFSYSSDNGTNHCFLDISTNKFHELNLMESPDSRCCVSSQGWLVFVEETPAIRLVNPLTRNVIHLPPLTTLSNVLDFNIFNIGNECLYQDSWYSHPSECSKTFMRDYFIKKVVLSSSPNSLENDYIALLVLFILPGLAFHKKGVEEWSIIEDARYFYEDAIYYNGSFYAITNEGIISICDISGVSPIVTQIIVAESPTLANTMAYLIDSFGELMLVTINMEVDDSEYDSDHDYDYHSVNETVLRFSVFSYDSSEPEWVQMDTLGDHMLFLGGNSAVCLSASDFSGCQRNCIYFSSDSRSSENRHYDFGVYHLDDSSIVRFPYGQSSTHYFLPPPIWFTPSPC